MLLPTSLVGSYPQPDWLIDRRAAVQAGAAGAHARSVAGRSATSRSGAGRRDPAGDPRPGARRPRHHHRRRAAPRKLFQPFRHRARRHRPRQSRHAPSTAAASIATVPRVVGKIRRKHPVEVRDVKFLRANTDRTIKMTVPGPFTMSASRPGRFLRRRRSALAMDYAAAVNDEIKDLFAAGADIVQIDEPWMQSRPEKARHYGLKALDRALDGVDGHDRDAYVLRLCRGGAGQALRLFIPGGVRALGGRAGLDRGGAAQARSFGPASNCRRRPSSSA